MRSGRTLVVALIAALAAGGGLGCRGGGGDASAVAVVPGAPAGDVTELAGDVKATRAGATRVLAKGDVVSGDDEIATGADGRVTIVLRHNQVAWSLGPGKSKRVAESVAWAAARGARAEDVTDDHSAAGGRHAERSATESAASTAAPTDEAAARAASQQAALEDQQRQLQAEEQNAEAKRAALEAALREQEAEAHAHAKPKGTGGGGAGSGGKHATCAPGDPLCDDFEAATAGGFGSSPGGAAVEGAIDPAAIRGVMRAHAADFKRCYDQLLAKGAAAGKLTLRMTIDADGLVTKLDLTGDAALTPMSDCIGAAVKKLVFPAPHGEVSVSYPMVFGN